MPNDASVNFVTYSTNGVLTPYGRAAELAHGTSYNPSDPRLTQPLGSGGQGLALNDPRRNMPGTPWYSPVGSGGPSAISTLPWYTTPQGPSLSQGGPPITGPPETLPGRTGPPTITTPTPTPSQGQPQQFQDPFTKWMSQQMAFPYSGLQQSMGGGAMPYNPAQSGYDPSIMPNYSMDPYL